MSYWTNVNGYVKGIIHNKVSLKKVIEDTFDGYDTGRPQIYPSGLEDGICFDFSFDGSDEEAVGRLLVFTSKLKQHKLTYDFCVTTRFHN